MSKLVSLSLCLFFLTISIPAFTVMLGLDGADVDPLSDICIIDVSVDSPFGEAEIRFDCTNVYVDLGDVWWDELLDPVWKVIRTNGISGTITLHERFHITGETPFSDWDEQLFRKNICGEWIPSTCFDGLYWNGGESVPEGVFVIDEKSDIITVEWDPALEPCTVVEITKTINVPGKICGDYIFGVLEMPSIPDGGIPEPSAFALSGLLMLGLFIFRKK